MNLITWFKSAYFKKFSNMIYVSIPIEESFFKDYIISHVFREKENIKIIFMKNDLPK
jgi:hypothetical protein